MQAEPCHNMNWQSQKLQSTNTTITVYAVVALSVPDSARPCTNTSASKRKYKSESEGHSSMQGQAGEQLSAPFGEQHSGEQAGSSGAMSNSAP